MVAEGLAWALNEAQEGQKDGVLLAFEGITTVLGRDNPNFSPELMANNINDLVTRGEPIPNDVVREAAISDAIRLLEQNGYEISLKMPETEA